MSDPQPPAGWYPAPHPNNEPRYWDGAQWLEPQETPQPGGHDASAALGVTPGAPEGEAKKSRKGWIIGGSIAAGLILIGGIGAALSGGGSADAEPESTVTPWHPPEEESPEPEPTTEEPVEEEPVGPIRTVERQEFNGTGDMVVDVSLTEAAIVTFTCNDCSSNTVLKTNGGESLLVNTIGGYSGSHLVNLNEGSMITRFTVESQGNWGLVVDDLITAPIGEDRVEGTGDAVVVMTGNFDVAAITNDGDSNFVVQAYGDGNWSPLIVNEIGAYSGTVEMSGPAYVQVISTGFWTITAQ